MTSAMLLLLVLLLPLGLPGPLALGSRLPGKGGQCPPPGRGRPQHCDRYCSTDSDCPGSERCCDTGCGRECRLPMGAKRGFCPRPDPDLVTIMPVKCGSDSECQGREKCCHARCMRLVPAKPGTCPKRRVLQTFAPCTSSCSYDTDCPLRQKCCFTGCGLGCLPPDTGTA